MTGRLLLLAAVLFGCGDDGAAEDERCVAGMGRSCTTAAGLEGVQWCGPAFLWSECGPRGDDGAAASMPIPPAEPQPPSLLPCPDGWTEVARADGIVECEPWPRGTDTSCPAGEAWFPGSSGCQPLGTTCPSGPLPDGLPSDVPVIHVVAGAMAGDGSRAAPWGSFRDFSVGTLRSSTVVAVGVGTYDVFLNVPEGVSIWGACAGRTTITSSLPSPTEYVITALGPGVALRGLTVGPSARPGIHVPIGTSLDMEGVDVRANQILGIFALDARLSMRRCASSANGYREDGRLGNAIDVGELAVADMDEVVFAQSGEVAINVVGPNAQLDAIGVAVRDTLGRESGEEGRALEAAMGAAVSVREGVFERSGDVSVAALDPVTRVDLTDSVVRDARGRDLDRRHGRGLETLGGATVTVSRTVFARNHDLAIDAFEADSELRLTDVVVDDTRAQVRDGAFGRALGVADGASAEVTRAVVRGSRDLAVHVSGSGSHLALTDVRIAETLGGEIDGAAGRALEVSLGATVTVARAAVEESGEVGVFAATAGTVVELEDLIVRDTVGQRSSGSYGRAMAVQDGAVVSGARALLERNRELSLSVSGAGTSVALDDLSVVDTLEQTCSTTTCQSAPGGIGVGVTSGSVTLRRFAIRGAALCGVLVARDGRLELRGGTVSMAAIGACVQVDEYDLGLLTDAVLYEDNGSNLDATELPIPSALDGSSPP